MTIITGTSDADTLNGTAIEDNISGLDGADEIFGGIGSDTLDGGNGNDIIYGDEQLLENGGLDSNQGPGGFSFGGVDGWYNTGSGGRIERWGDGFLGLNTADGSSFIELDVNGGTPLDHLQTDLELGTGVEYTLTIDAAARAGGSANDDFEVTHNGTVIATISPASTTEFTTYTVTFNGLAGLDTIGLREFSGQSNGSGILLDNLQISLSAAEIAASASNFNDSIDGGSGNDTIFAQEGDDTVDGGNGLDSINGSIGDDSLSGGTGNDTILGGIGLDTINGDDGNDLLNGDSEDDTVDGGLGFDTIIGGDGNDSVDGGGHDDSIDGDDGLDTLDGGDGDDTILGGLGNDSILGGLGDDSLLGENGNDTIIGDVGLDTIFGGGGNDSIDGGGNNDFIDGGIGNDTIIGDVGLDTIFGGDGNDSIDGGIGNDTVDSGIGDDSIDGGIGNDTVDGGIGDDSIDGGTGNDIIFSESGNDTINAGDDADNVFAGSDNDLVNGNEGNDILRGENGNDSIHGGQDNDTLEGGAGDDTLHGDMGNDTIDTGAGTADLIIQNVEAGSTDTILNFRTDDATAVVDLTDFLIPSFERLDFTQVGGDTHLDLGDGQTLVFQGVVAANLSENDFMGFNGGTTGSSSSGTNDTTLTARVIQSANLNDFEVFDWNGDGVLDIVSYNGSLGAGWNWYNGADDSVNFISSADYGTSDNWTIIDYNTDGVGDIVTDFFGDFRVYYGGGGTHVTLDAGPFVSYSVGDFDNNGTNEFQVFPVAFGFPIGATDEELLEFVINDGNSYNIGSADGLYHIADIDDDGTSEVLVTTGGYIDNVMRTGIWQWNEDNTYTQLTSDSATRVIAADWDNDGVDDILVVGGGFSAGLDQLVYGGDDVIVGTANNDTLAGGNQNDTITGANGNDIFAFTTDIGHDQINDFSDNSSSNHDTLQFTGVTGITTATDVISNSAIVGSDTIITIAGEGTITLIGFTSLETNDIVVV